LGRATRALGIAALGAAAALGTAAAISAVVAAVGGGPFRARTDVGLARALATWEDSCERVAG
jgi:hypothetical protein